MRIMVGTLLYFTIKCDERTQLFSLKNSFITIKLYMRSILLILISIRRYFPMRLLKCGLFLVMVGCMYKIYITR